jgi:hypothetical protein
MDINEENALATASVDNVIAFWNTFVGTESKHYKMPRSLVQSEINQNIQSVRFLKGRDHRYLLIIINTGQIYMMDCLKVHLLNYENDQNVL